MDKENELPELVNGLSLRSPGNGDSVAEGIDSLLREISSLFSSIYGKCVHLLLLPSR